MKKMMKVPVTGEEVSVSTQPWWLCWLPTGYTITLSPNIYTTDELLAGPPSDLNDIIVHENVHLHQQAPGRFKFFFKYVFSRSFRYQAEFEAYCKQFQYYIDTNRPLLVDMWIIDTVEALSSSNYLWCVSKDKALADFNGVFHKKV